LESCRGLAVARHVASDFCVVDAVTQKRLKALAHEALQAAHGRVSERMQAVAAAAVIQLAALC